MKFYIIGIDDNKRQKFPVEVQEIIASHTVFSGGLRHYEIIKACLPPNHVRIDITVPLHRVFEEYHKHPEVVVFVSGDPLFFGFANTIQRMMPDAEMVLFPNFNSLQLLAHRIQMPYHDMHVVSLTGRPWDKLDEALITGYDKIGIFTDNCEHTPATIAKRMLYYGYDNYRMTVGELLGNHSNEKISVLSLKEAVKRRFESPNNLVLQKIYSRPRPFGIPENEFELLNERAKMITKMPVRLLSLSMLEMRSKTVFWDIGFCTGSVSVEAKLQFPHLTVIAFEQRPESSALIENNSRKFGTPGIISITGDFTQTDISVFPIPDAVFIGGHGGKMNEIIGIIANVLNERGVIVFNSVSEESSKLFSETIHFYQLKKEQSIYIKIDDFNTIEVMKAVK